MDFNRTQHNNIVIIVLHRAIIVRIIGDGDLYFINRRPQPYTILYWAEITEYILIYYLVRIVVSDYTLRMYSIIIGRKIDWTDNNGFVLIIIILFFYRKILIVIIRIENIELIDSRDVNPEFIVECIYFTVEKKKPL